MQEGGRDVYISRMSPGQVSEFQQYGTSHMAVLAFTGFAILLLLAGAKQIRHVPDDRFLRYPAAILLTFVAVTSWCISVLRWGVAGLPLQLSDVALLLTLWGLFQRHRYVREFAFFLGLGGGTQALLTPDVHKDFPSLSWFAFFVTHSGVVLSAVYFAVRGGLGLSIRSIWRVWLTGNVYVAAVMLLNGLWGTNYMYLARKPAQPSLLDHLGPWPVYIFWGELIALALFFLCYAFYLYINRIAED